MANAIDKCLSPDSGTECGLQDILFILRKRNMKEIGLKLKEKREENGVSVEEAAEDLKVRPSQITSLEEGKKEDFKDILFLKYLIRDYAKYLGLDGEKILDEFNEFLFDFTSKIPLAEIEKAKSNKSNSKPIISPYTKEKKKNQKQKMLVISIIIVICIIAVGYVIASSIHRSDFQDDNITYTIRR